MLTEGIVLKSLSERASSPNARSCGSRFWIVGIYHRRFERFMREHEEEQAGILYEAPVLLVLMAYGARTRGGSAYETGNHQGRDRSYPQQYY
jgi:hypothetical protein